MTIEGALAKSGLVQDKSKEVVYKFTVPAKLSKETGVTAIGVVALSAQDELIATSRANGDQLRLGLESVKMALRWIEKGKQRINISTGDASIDSFWNEPSNVKLRQLVTSAMVKINRPEVEDVESFLDSVEVVVE